MGGKGSGAKPREYPSDIVALACGLYESGLTVREVQEQLPAGYKAQRILERHLPARRPLGNHKQSGSENKLWKGDDATYGALHLRVEAARGKPKLCSWCGKTEGVFHWANLSGKYTDVEDYERLCVSCHIAYDAGRRAVTGQPTMGRYAGHRKR